MPTELPVATSSDFLASLRGVKKETPKPVDPTPEEPETKTVEATPDEIITDDELGE